MARPSGAVPLRAQAAALHGRIKHYPQAPVQWVSAPTWMPGSEALLLYDPDPADAILFIHGWGGNAGGTWESFPQLAATMSEASGADIFFLDYPSLESQVPFCAAQLRSFLMDLVRAPADTIINSSLPATAPRRTRAMRYRRIVVIAHSMGAVIARRALLDLDLPPPDGLTDDELGRFAFLFFAPAHCGSAIPLLIGSGLGLDFLPGAKLIGALARLWFQSLRDLEEGSAFLAKLAQDNKQTREARTGRGGSIGHLRAIVYHAHNDRVVSQNGFDQDPPFRPVMDQNHRSICKPNAEYREPFEALRAILGR
ncbi:MAG TPA: alpha/beta fold hydrolase [Xanthobacteraceae bacterium]|jgi:pimeloyl-ACP methyl ester carboxylesterase